MMNPTISEKSLPLAKPAPERELQITPGKLIKRGETMTFRAGVSGHLSIRYSGNRATESIAEAWLEPGIDWSWTPTEPGRYQAEFVTRELRLKRPLAVVEAGWAVCQVTIGAFTSEDFAELVHEAGLPVNYYVSAGRVSEFSVNDPRWKRYEREFGDDIYPHVMAKDIGNLNAEFSHDDANWASLSEEEIEKRLSYLKAWWEAQGFEPLDRIATYTPCNRFIDACRRTGIRTVHSVVPEQNWSDGEWVINHWGMPTCPFWFARDDFRKAMERTADGVVAMTMNHYHVLLPHLTRWGDFVLSPSHFARWIRAADSGEESVRFKQFLADTVRGWKSLSGDPFFFVAGFEFGRNFGTANMTPYNLAGLAALLRLAKTEKLVFATGRDVRAYYERHLPHLPETAFRQRDNWIGCTVNGKPGQAVDSAVVERRDYKSLIREGEMLPFLYYDYRVEWTFEVDDPDAPRDFAPDIRRKLFAERDNHELRLKADAPLDRTVPIALWDCELIDSPFSVISLPLLDDERAVALIEIPCSWSGDLRVKLRRVPSPLKRREDIWKMQTFGSNGSEHTYLHLDAPLVNDVSIPLVLKKKAAVDGVTGTLGELEPGVHSLPFGPLLGWYRFWGCGVADILPPEDVGSLIGDSVLSSDWQKELATHLEALNHRAAGQMDPAGELVYQIHCGAQLPLGNRSRSAEFDLVVKKTGSISAVEKADGVIAFGPGRSFWYHPRGLSVEITGLNPEDHYQILLHTFDPFDLAAKYVVSANGRERGKWEVPNSMEDPRSFFPIDIDPGDVGSRGEVSLSFRTDQQQVIHWWKDKGFIAALHALWIIKLPPKSGSLPSLIQ